MGFDMKKMQIGTLIEQARNEAGLSREKLAEELDVATTTVLRWEKGTLGPSFENVLKASLILKKPISYFTGVETTTRENPFEIAVNVLQKIAQLNDRNRDLMFKSVDQMILAQSSSKKKAN